MADKKERCGCAFYVIGANSELNDSTVHIKDGVINYAVFALSNAEKDLSHAEKYCGVEFKKTRMHIEKATQYLQKRDTPNAGLHARMAISELHGKLFSCKEGEE